MQGRPAFRCWQGLIPFWWCCPWSCCCPFWSTTACTREDFCAGKPVILMENGRLLQDNMKKTRITPDELTEFARMEGITDLSGVKYAILKPVGRSASCPTQNINRLAQRTLA